MNAMPPVNQADTTEAVRARNQARMKPIKIVFDKVGNTLNVWFDDPKKEHIAEETAEEIVLIKDKRGKVIGFEVLNYLSAKESRELRNLSVESKILT